MHIKLQTSVRHRREGGVEPGGVGVEGQAMLQPGGTSTKEAERRKQGARSGLGGGGKQQQGKGSGQHALSPALVLPQQFPEVDLAHFH